MGHHAEVVVVGASIIDVATGPVDASVFETGRQGVPQQRLGFGGDALNQSVTLSRLGHRVRLVSKVGHDSAGSLILEYCERNRLNQGYIQIQPGLDTGVNIVLVTPDGERCFITSESGGLRALRPGDIPKSALLGAEILSFASVFVFPHFGCQPLAALFEQAKKEGLVLCADFTSPKNGETAQQMRPALRYLDYAFPNYQEAKQLTGKTTLDDIADQLLDCGVKHVVIKTGADGCFIKYAGGRLTVPALPGIQSVDSTGAGDSFAAGFISGLLQGRGLEQSARIANASASLTVETFGQSVGVRDRAALEQRLALYKD